MDSPLLCCFLFCSFFFLYTQLRVLEITVYVHVFLLNIIFELCFLFKQSASFKFATKRY